MSSFFSLFQRFSEQPNLDRSARAVTMGTNIKTSSKQGKGLTSQAGDPVAPVRFFHVANEILPERTETFWLASRWRPKAFNSQLSGPEGHGEDDLHIPPFSTQLVRNLYNLQPFASALINSNVHKKTHTPDGQFFFTEIWLQNTSHAEVIMSL